MTKEETIKEIQRTCKRINTFIDIYYLINIEIPLIIILSFVLLKVLEAKGFICQ